ncbi:hypothetical protein KHQ84_gp146 [Rhodococcus phage Finch]|uniref:Uncharacterized protein n=1 Tax=Rhodococcus phage Finch TaxID=2094144 RepID=A0A2P1JXM6_9CAUD|nr:hypothetical protein KHQ84_gp146 [Rhodococcus phage Finch]AVO25076.1 hypothetical protein SEA_FINCH_146 [Rhodococcus phage Finch]
MISVAESWTGTTLTETGVYPGVGDYEGKFVAYFRLGGGGSTSLHNTREEAELSIQHDQEGQARFWNEKVTWASQGDRTTPNRAFRDCLRIDGCHYIPRQLGASPDGPFKGFGGRTFRWVYLDDPTGTVYESNDVMYQGDIPSGMADVLPDNAAWAQ